MATDCLLMDEYGSAEKTIQECYPFVPIKNSGRHYSVKQMITQFFADGFVDRYSGKRLVNPGLLRILSLKLPEAFPYQSHWKTDACHIAYWDYQPTVDHIVPVSLGGADTPDNWATTSMMNNSAKGNFSLEQLGWTLKKKGDINQWDGLSKEFVALVEKDSSFLRIGRIKDYYIATKETLKEFGVCPTK